MQNDKYSAEISVFAWVVSFTFSLKMKILEITGN